MRKTYITFISLLLIVMSLTGCSPAKSQGTNAWQDASDQAASHSERTLETAQKQAASLVNKQLQKYFGLRRLSYCDEWINDGIYYATIYGDADTIEIFIEYDIENNILISNAAEVYHKKDIEKAIAKTVSKTMGLKNTQEETYYSLRVNAERTAEFIEDYHEFIANDGTKIDLTLFFDEPISDSQATQIQNLMKKLKEQHFNGYVDYLADSKFSDEFDINKTYTVEEIKDL